MKKKQSNYPTLLVLSPVTAYCSPDGGIHLSRKFIEGIELLLDYWPGKLVVGIESSTSPSGNLDETRLEISTLPFGLEMVDYRSNKLDQLISTAGIVLATSDYRQNHVADLCTKAMIPCVYVVECGLANRLEIIKATSPSSLKTIWRSLKELIEEHRRISAIRLANGVQCNGIPSHTAYAIFSRHPHLFFDGRVSRSMLITEQQLEQRLEWCQLPGRPLRLLFSGRLTEIKGVQYLVPLAVELRRLGVTFSLSICGDGNLRKRLEDEVSALEIGDSIHLLGNLDFENELLPLTSRSVDLFVCPHPQRDPSCTYLEVMSCGVPIVGFGNEALKGLIGESSSGWASPIGDVEALARLIYQLNNERQLIASHSRLSRAFAASHTFESTFEGRTRHLLDVLENERARSAALG